MNAEIDKINYLVVGIGVNVNLDRAQVPGELSDIAVSLEEQNRLKVTRIQLLAALLNNLDSLYLDFLDGKFNQILTLNRWVKVVSGNYVEEGIAFDLDDDGALILMKKDGSIKRVLSGDVSVRA